MGRLSTEEMKQYGEKVFLEYSSGALKLNAQEISKKYRIDMSDAIKVVHFVRQKNNKYHHLILSDEKEIKKEVNSLKTEVVKDIAVTEEMKKEHKSRRPQHKISDEDIKEVTDYINSYPKTSVREISEMMDVSIYTANKLLKIARDADETKKAKVSAKKPDPVVEQPKKVEKAKVSAKKPEPDFNYRRLGQSDFVEAELVAERHNTPAKLAIFSQSAFSGPYSIRYDFEAQNAVVEKFIKTHIPFDEQGNAQKYLRVYLTGLQTAYTSVMTTCYKMRVNLMVEEYDDERRIYHHRDAINIYPCSSKISKLDYLQNVAEGRSVYLYDVDEYNLPNTVYDFKVLKFDRPGGVITSIKHHIFRSIDDAFKAYIKMAKVIHIMPVPTGIYMNSINCRDTDVKAKNGVTYAKTFNFNPPTN